jgi:PTS system nitrogen regulatory IIA component
MQLSVREVARLLKVSENTVYRWVDERSLPAQQVDSKYFFNKAELLEWAALHKVDVAPEIFAAGPNGNGSTPTLASALEAGGMHYGVEGADRASVLRAVVSHMKFPPNFDRDLLLELNEQGIAAAPSAAAELCIRNSRRLGRSLSFIPRSS